MDAMQTLQWTQRMQAMTQADRSRAAHRAHVRQELARSASARQSGTSVMARLRRMFAAGTGTTAEKVVLVTQS